MSYLAGNTTAARAGLGIAVVCVAQFVAVLDVTIVVTALPAVRRSLGFSAAGLPWVVTAYTLVLGGLLISAGRVADVVGRRPVFLAGLASFALTSTACALAWSPAALLGARVLQGAAAAVLAPAALSLLTTLTEPGESRRRAVGWWTAAAAGGGASGWVLGGLITEYAGWRWVFGVNLPIGLVAALVAAHVLPRGSERAAKGFDLAGAVLATGGLASLLLGLSGAAERGPWDPLTWAPLLLASLLLGLFVVHERSTSHPILPPGLLRSRPIAGANLTAIALTASTSPAMYLVTVWTQDVLGLPPGRTSLMFPALNLSVIAGSLAGPWALRRLGARQSLLIGLAGVAAGSVLLAGLPATDLPLARVLSSFVLMGAGLGLASVASTEVGTMAAAPADRGAASGVLNSAAQVGTALGLAVLVPLASSVGGAVMDGYHVAFLGAGLVALLGGLAALLVRSERSRKSL